MIISAPSRIDEKLFGRNIEVTEARYGLPTKVIYCKKCVISNQRPNSTNEFENSPSETKSTIKFESDGVCDACKLAEKKNLEIDWTRREKELIELCDKFRRTDGNYDCIVPGSGGKDSFFASHVLREEYGMNPLTVTWAPHLYTDWGWRNFQSWIGSGFDNHLITPNTRVHRILTRLALEKLLHPFQPFIYGQKTVAAKLAIQLKIPLVFYGENEAEYGNPIAEAATSVRNQRYYAINDLKDVKLAGFQIKELVDKFGLSLNDLLPYLPVNPKDMTENSVEVHYLGYYLKWHPQSCYYYAVEKGGFIASPERTPGTYSKYNSIDDKVDDLHYYTTGAKFGIGRATYDAAQEIRSGDITRDEGVALVKKFDHEFPSRFINELMDYLSIGKDILRGANTIFEVPRIDVDYFNSLVDNFRSPHIWYFESDKWYLRTPIS